MTLDNRPKKLRLQGAKSENLQAVRDWYEVSRFLVSTFVADFHAKTTGQMDSIDLQEDGDVVVAFKTRAAAEQVSLSLAFSFLPHLFPDSNFLQGLGKGPNIPTVGQVQISWYTEKPSATSSQSISVDKSNVSSTSKPSQGSETHVRAHRHTPEPDVEEEMVARGWGGDDYGDGMGML